MIASIVKVETNMIRDWDTFHQEFDRVFGFPDFYGCNMDAWIDCMSSLAYPDDGMTRIHCEEGKVITIELEDARVFKERCPDQYDALVECTAFVNWRLIEGGQQPVLTLSFNL